jgi:hypothetical protein
MASLAETVPPLYGMTKFATDAITRFGQGEKAANVRMNPESEDLPAQ